MRRLRGTTARSVSLNGAARHTKPQARRTFKISRIHWVGELRRACGYVVVYAGEEWRDSTDQLL
jgi:hypothetical protein